MRAKILLYNVRIYTQADGLVADSMAVSGNRIVAVGNNLQHDPDFRSYSRINLKGKTIVPGMVDAHTHFGWFARSLRMVSLEGLDSMDRCLQRIKDFSRGLGKDEWIVGGGYSPDRLRKRVEPDRYMLDRVSGGRPVLINSKDAHSVWVNSRALDLIGIGPQTPDPAGGRIDRLPDGSPAGILRETACNKAYAAVPPFPRRVMDDCYGKALRHAYKKGVTGVHSVDDSETFVYFTDLAEKGKLGLRINYYMSASKLPDLQKSKVRYGSGDDYLRLAGVKIFADGSLGSQSAFCYNKYLGSKDNYGLEVTLVPELRRLVRSAARLGLPCAVHAIGDRAVSNVLDALEGAPPLGSGARHRIEHLQLIRRRDIPRLKRLKVVASMQPSHCPADIQLVRRYWGSRGANAYIFRTLLNSGVDLAFGSDCPIEPLDPLAGIAAAVRRALPGGRDILYPEQRITPLEALYCFTVGPAVASGQSQCRGYLLPGYPADFVVLSDDPCRVAPGHIYDIEVLATVLDGRPEYGSGPWQL